MQQRNKMGFPVRPVVPVVNILLSPWLNMSSHAGAREREETVSAIFFLMSRTQQSSPAACMRQRNKSGFPVDPVRPVVNIFS